jgi:uncharacterized protein YPO0396
MAHTRLRSEALARVINKGFKDTASKEDIKGVKEDIQQLREEMNERIDHLDARVGRLEADVHTLRDEMVRRSEFEDALDRVKYIEKKLGIESGV